MLIRFFNSSYLAQFVILILLGITFWFGHILNPPLFTENITLQPLFNLVNGWIHSIPLVGALLGLACLLIQAFLLSGILSANQIVQKNSLMPTLLVLVTGSIQPQLLVFNPCSLAIIFLLVAFGRLLRCYGKTDTARDILSASFYIALGSLFCFPVIYFLPLIWIMLIAFSISGWREWLIPFIGLSIPYIYLFSFYYLTDSPELEFTKYRDILNFSWDIENRMRLIDYFIAGITGIFFVSSFSYYISTIQGKNILVRKRMLIALWMLIVSLANVFQNHLDFIWITPLILLPVTVFISYHLGQLARSRILNILLWILLILILVNNNFISLHA